MSSQRNGRRDYFLHRNMVKLGHNIGDRVTIRRRSIGYAWRYCRHGSRGAIATPLDQTRFHTTHSRGHTVVAACHSGMTLLGKGFPWQEPAHARGTTPAAAILHSVAASRRRQQSVAVWPPRSLRGQPQESKANEHTTALPWQIQKLTHCAKASNTSDNTSNSLSQIAWHHKRYINVYSYLDLRFRFNEVIII